MRTEHEFGMLDTNVLILQDKIDHALLPERTAISAVTLAELASGPGLITGSTPEDIVERARRIDVWQRTERAYVPCPFDGNAARMYGQMSALVVAVGRKPRTRTADLMIAATAATEGLPLYTTNPNDFHGLESLVDVVAVPRPNQGLRAVPPTLGR